MATECGVWSSPPAYAQNIISFAVSAVFWLVCFYGCWFFFPSWERTKVRWQEMNASDRYGLCGILHSTLHGIIVPVGVIVCMTDCGIWGNWLAADCTKMQLVFAWTASYFTVDTVLIVYYKGANWVVFLFHHIVGAMPFYINCFGCPNMQFLIGAGILIEAICPLLNLRAVLEMFGKKETKAGAAAFFLTYVVWLPLRVGLPLYLTIGMFSFSVPGLKEKIPDWAVVPSYVTGFCITVFCVAIWLLVLSPEIPWAYRLLFDKNAAADAEEEHKGVKGDAEMAPSERDTKRERGTERERERERFTDDAVTSTSDPYSACSRAATNLASSQTPVYSGLPPMSVAHYARKEAEERGGEKGGGGGGGARYVWARIGV